MRNWQLIAARLERDGELLTTTQAAKLIPAHRGRRSHISTQCLVRWIVHGRHGIYLDGVKTGAAWSTTRQAVIRFLAQCSEQAEPEPMPDTLAQRERIAKQVLARMRAG